ncbi:hypothetical protein [Raoultibacter massiliensis]|uniref:hypothetical protein n=1 Tax=Raoultibacter massiliensis TaxID=1852371 RepID=UPI000C85FA10|nr:hypothetical protein [Raoultibacter massiliensis]
MEFDIKKGKDIKINIRPVTISVYHEYVFEGPCRFGKGDELTKDFDMMSISMVHKQFVDEVQERLGKLPFVNIVDPVVIKRDETFPVTDELLAEMAGDVENTDVYLLKFHPFGIDFALEFARTYRKPLATVLQCCNDSGLMAALRPRGFEGYSWIDWDSAIDGLKVLRARKALAKTRVLCIPRANSNNSLSALDSFYDHSNVTEKLGVQFRYYNLHEFMDQTKNVDPMSNPTLPGRLCDNINDEDEAEIKRIADELISGAEECDMKPEDVYPSVRANYLVNKLLAKLECNAFAAPCPDMCATRRLNEERFTLCLNHSLNNENGVCSACEYDISALVSMVLLSNLSFSAPYMGNTSVGKTNGNRNPEVSPLLTLNKDSYADASDTMAGVKDIAYTFHATPNRLLKGFDADREPYALRPFAMGGRWGATIRYDFNNDKGQTVTMCRFDPLCEKIFIARGTIVSGIGYKDENCTEGAFFKVADARRFYECSLQVGNHIPLVYGDVYDNACKLADILGLEILTCE